MKLLEESTEFLQWLHGPRTDASEKCPEFPAGDLRAPGRRGHAPVRVPEDHGRLRHPNKEPVCRPPRSRRARCATRQVMEISAESRPGCRPRLVEDPPCRLPDGGRHRVSPHHLLPEPVEEVGETVELTPLHGNRSSWRAAEFPDRVPETGVVIHARGTHETADRLRKPEERGAPPCFALPLGPGEDHCHGGGIGADRPDKDHVDGDPFAADPEPEGVGDDHAGPRPERNGRCAPAPAGQPSEPALQLTVQRAVRPVGPFLERADGVSAGEKAQDRRGLQAAEGCGSGPPVAEPERSRTGRTTPAARSMNPQNTPAAGTPRASLSPYERVCHATHSRFQASGSQKLFENSTRMVDQNQK